MNEKTANAIGHLLGHLSWSLAFISEMRFVVSAMTEVIALLAGSVSLYVLVKNNTSLFSTKKTIE